MSEIQLFIDNRETKVIDYLNQSEKQTLPFIISQLDLGDFCFRDKVNSVILIIERKTIQDLSSSITDGRYREQKARLLSCGIPMERIMYIIEGNIDKEFSHKVPVDTLVSSMINTQLRDNIKVYRTFSLKETCEFIQKLYDKLNTNGPEFFKETIGKTKVQYASTLKKEKKGNLTPDVWYLSQLSSIPRISIEIAESISKKYPSFIELFKEYEKTPEHLRKKLLSDFKLNENVEDQTVRKRKTIGNANSERIYNFVYGINNTQQEKLEE